MLNPYLKLFYKSNRIESFENFDAGYFSKLLVSKKPAFWQKAGERMALSLFKSASRRVPAYADFLKKCRVKPEKIKKIDDFRHLPVTDKAGYLKSYPLEMLCWDGKLEKNSIFSVSSGSSGVPFFWPRGENLELETSIYHELFLKDFFGIGRRPTLFINTFSMGIYIAGVLTLNAVLKISQKNYPLMIITPGINLDEILRIVREIGSKFEQIIISGYPPFIKDMLERGEMEGLNWKKIKIKFLFATEGFSEQWRDYVLNKVGAKDPLNNSLNIYGSADAGILGHETPICIFLRRKLPDLFKRDNVLPTLTQYNPFLKFFEIVNNEVIFSCYGGIPLIRYNIHDSGGIKNFNEVAGRLSAEALRNNVWKLPFLYVFSKSDNICSLYGVKIYPENVRTHLEEPALNKSVTGKFVMATKNMGNQDQYLEINCELKNAVKPTENLKDKARKIILKTLADNNLEYRTLRASIGKKADPEIILWPKDHQKYFDPRSIKQRWKKNL